MRELKVVGLDVDGQHILCEEDDRADAFRLRVDDRLRAAVRGDAVRPSRPHNEVETRSVLRPKEIQARIRAGASVEQLAESAGWISPASHDSPTRYCWSAAVQLNWLPPHIRYCPMAPRC